MAKITQEIAKKIEKIARKLTISDKDLFWDAYQEGLAKVCEMVNGHTESYYVQYAYRRIQDFMRKERRFFTRHLSLNDDDEKLMGSQKLAAQNYDEWSQNDYITYVWLAGKEV